MSIKPTPLRRQDAAGVSDIAGAKTLTWDDADKYFGRRAYGIHEMNADYMTRAVTGGVVGKCKVTGSPITSSATGVTLIDADPTFNGHKSLYFDGSVGAGVQYEKKDVVSSFARIVVLSLDAEMYAPTLTGLRNTVAVYGSQSDAYNHRLSTRNVSGQTKQQFAIGSSSNNTNLGQLLPAAGTPHVQVIAFDAVSRKSRICINDPKVYSEFTHTALTVGTDDAWVIGGGPNDNASTVFKGRMTDDIIIDVPLNRTSELWGYVVEHVAFLRTRYGITL
ncbi:hypothetical protein [Methylobacterium sp.]|uniref:hypothetical protein n=1 Tax=Methylobacterium sp. TaxID=409 RepID=UPI003B025008